MSCDQVSEIDKLKLQKIANLLEQKKQLKAVNLDGGKGGYGQVIIVQDSSQKEFAIKVISIFDGVDDISEIKKKDAEDEAQSLKNFPHPNIVKYFDDFQIGNNYFILMEKCEKSLQQLVDSKEELSEDLIMKFIFEISEAISFLHSGNLVLRDVSLKNILLDKEQNE